jgi:hypothetical protein
MESIPDAFRAPGTAMLFAPFPSIKRILEG